MIMYHTLNAFDSMHHMIFKILMWKNYRSGNLNEEEIFKLFHHGWVTAIRSIVISHSASLYNWCWSTYKSDDNM